VRNLEAFGLSRAQIADAKRWLDENLYPVMANLDTTERRLDELKAERDDYRKTLNETAFQLGATMLQRDRLVEALRKVLDGGITDHQVPCGLFKEKGICDCGLVEWQRATRALLAEIDGEDG
jgi:hypothetical protein